MAKNKNIRRIVLAGGGHAHLEILKNARQLTHRGYELVLITPSEFLYYSGMGPAMLRGLYRQEDTRIPVKRLLEKAAGRVILSKVKRVFPEDRTVQLWDGRLVEYDVVSFNIGSEVNADFVSTDARDVYPVKPIENLLKVRSRLLQNGSEEIKAVIIGGGPAGVEVAGNIMGLLSQHKKKGFVTLIAGSKLLKTFPSKVRELVIDNFTRRQINVIEGVRVKKVNEQKAILTDGRELFYDICIVATGVKPPDVFRLSSMAVAADGSLLVNSTLQSKNYNNIFGGGDCISIEGMEMKRVGVYAVKQAPVLFHNIVALCEGRGYKEFKPPRKFMLILNLGDGKAILTRGNLRLDGKLATWIKDRIDTRFVKQYQIKQ